MVDLEDVREPVGRYLEDNPRSEYHIALGGASKRIVEDGPGDCTLGDLVRIFNGVYIKKHR